MLGTGVKLGAAGGWCSCGSVGLDSRVLGNVPNPGGSAGSLKVALVKGESTDGPSDSPRARRVPQPVRVGCGGRGSRQTG